MAVRRALAFFIALLLVLPGLGACTRARTPWPEESAIALPSVVPPTSTPVPTSTLTGPLLPRYTPHVTQPPTPTPIAFATPTPAPTAAPSPTATPAPPPLTPISPDAVIYVVKPGDLFYDIAQKFNVPLAELARANNITDPTSIRPGQQLIIP